MGKAKKGKKVDEENEVSNSVDVDDEITTKSKKKEKKRAEPVDSESEDDAKMKKSLKKEGKKTGKDDDSGKVSKKDKKKVTVDDDDEDDDDTPLPSKKKPPPMKDDSSDDDVIAAPVKPSKKKAKGGFAALALSDDDEPPERIESDNDDIEEDSKPAKKKESKDKGGKKAKKKRKDDDEEDLEKILAELQMEYTGEAPPPPAATEVEGKKEEEEADSSKKKKKKKEKKATEAEAGDGETVAPAKMGSEGEDEEAHTVKTAAQKKKEKKEREKQKRLAEKAKDKQEVKESAEAQPVQEDETVDKERDSGAEDEDDDKKKKKKKKKGEKEEKPSGKLNKKMLAAIQETLKIQREEEERLRKEEEERARKEEEAERLRQEQIRLEQEKKEKRKQKEKEKKERLKAEGKLLNSKQKADRAKAQALLDAMNAMRIASGAEPITPSATASKAKPSFAKQKKKKSQPSDSSADSAPPPPSNGTEAPNSVKVEIVDQPQPPAEPAVEESEEVKDSWDLDSDHDDKSEEEKNEPAVEAVPESKAPAPLPEAKKLPSRTKSESESIATEDTESESDSDSGSDSESSSGSDNEKYKKTDAQKKREKVLDRIKKRQEAAEAKRTLDELRAAVVCVLGHVDTGKTKILDKLRRTNVQDGEAGGITQQIGATNVPIDAIKEQSKHVKGFSQMTLKIPGLLIIDTPGHESFSNLRSRGSSLCDLAILVVDIMHGLEPQTIESIQLLKDRRTPFIVALNKIDRLYDWQTMAKKDVRDIIKAQAPNTQLEFEQRTKEVIVQFAEQGLNAALFYDNPDARSYVSLVPTSAITGEGMGNILALIVEYCQTRLAKRLMFSEELQATVLEVKAIPGLGTTIDVILVNGYLREGDTTILAGTDAPIVTQIRSLLMPQPMKELRVKNAYVEYKEIKAAQGVKIAAKDLEKVIAGLNLRIAEKPDEVDILKEEVARELKSALSSIKLQERGVYVQASTLGSLEALLEFLRTSNIPYANIRIGPVVKKDVMKASIMLEHDSQYSVILAFDVKIERDAQELADSLGVKIFQADIIYHLFDKFMAYREELRNRKREEFKTIAVFPCKLKILPQFVFNSRDPIVVGVMVEAGIVKEGTPICVPSKDFIDIGIVTSIENNHKTVENARKGQEVCIKIEPIPGESPKMFGRHFDETDFLVSKITRQSIDACKDYFREDLVKTDWQLMVELKKLFQIL